MTPARIPMALGLNLHLHPNRYSSGAWYNDKVQCRVIVKLRLLIVISRLPRCFVGHVSSVFGDRRRIVKQARWVDVVVFAILKQAGWIDVTIFAMLKQLRGRLQVLGLTSCVRGLPCVLLRLVGGELILVCILQGLDR